MVLLALYTTHTYLYILILMQGGEQKDVRKGLYITVYGMRTKDTKRREGERERMFNNCMTRNNCLHFVVVVWVLLVPWMRVTFSFAISLAFL